MKGNIPFQICNMDAYKFTKKISEILSSLEDSRIEINDIKYEIKTSQLSIKDTNNEIENISKEIEPTLRTLRNTIDKNDSINNLKNMDHIFLQVDKLKIVKDSITTRKDQIKKRNIQLLSEIKNFNRVSKKTLETILQLNKLKKELNDHLTSVYVEVTNRDAFEILNENLQGKIIDSSACFACGGEISGLGLCSYCYDNSNKKKCLKCEAPVGENSSYCQSCENTKGHTSSSCCECGGECQGCCCCLVDLCYGCCKCAYGRKEDDEHESRSDDMALRVEPHCEDSSDEEKYVAKKATSFSSSEDSSDEEKDAAKRDTRKMNLREDEKKNIATNSYQCYKCGGRKCQVTETQRRSEDEIITKFITCLVCSNVFKK